MSTKSHRKPGPSLVIPKQLAPAAATPEPTGEKKQEPEAVPLPVATPSMTAENEDKILAKYGVTPAASPAATPTKKMTEDEEDEVLAKYSVKPRNPA